MTEKELNERIDQSESYFRYNRYKRTSDLLTESDQNYSKILVHDTIQTPTTQTIIGSSRINSNTNEGADNFSYCIGLLVM